MKPLHRGLTLVEILVAVALIVLLVSLLLIVLRPMQGLAQQTSSAAALRQMAAGFNAYAAENRQQLLPGYLAPIGGQDPVLDNPVNPRIPHGDSTLKDILPDELAYAAAARSYVWRLVPYLSDSWQTCYADAPTTDVMNQMSAAYSAGNLNTIAESPTFGMNSIFVGGDSRHGSAAITDRNPWFGSDQLAVTRLSQIRNPARLIVFGPTAPVGTGPVSNPESPDATYARFDLGYPELRAPYLPSGVNDTEFSDEQWQVGEGGRVMRTTGGAYGNGAGLPISRAERADIPIANVDGSTDTVDLGTLWRDRSRWSDAFTRTVAKSSAARIADGNVFSAWK